MSSVSFYGLTTRLHKPKVSSVKKRKRKPVQLHNDNLKSYKYKCYECHRDVYFLPGHDIVCGHCSCRIVEKTGDKLTKRTVVAR